MSGKYPNPMRSFKGQVPLTRFVDMEDSVCVEVMEAPEWLTIYPHMAELVEATHAIEPIRNPMPGSRAHAAIKGKGMWMLAEMPTFLLRITGVSRIFTHQLVRQRVGVTFMQQCTGDTDFRHCDIIVPRCMAEGEWRMNTYMTTCLYGKTQYAELVDAGIPVQSARYVLPHSIATFIYMKAPIGILAQLYNKRVCSMSQTWETVLFARRLKAAVLGECPEYAELFESACERGTCWWQGAKHTGNWTPMWQPDEVHYNADCQEWDEEEFIHPGTNEQVSSPRDVACPARYFDGTHEVEEEEWLSMWKDRTA